MQFGRIHGIAGDPRAHFAWRSNGLLRDTNAREARPRLRLCFERRFGILHGWILQRLGYRQLRHIVGIRWADDGRRATYA